MIATKPIPIPLNKRKLAGLLRLAIYFLIGGLFCASAIRLGYSLLPIIISCVGILQIVFSVPLAFFLLRKWKNKEVGITIDDTGITDKTILYSAGHIPWSDIQEIKETKDRLLIIIVSNPTTYISRQSSFVKRKLMRNLMKTYGSPIVITPNELNIGFPELKNILKLGLQGHKLGQSA